MSDNFVAFTAGEPDTGTLTAIDHQYSIRSGIRKLVSKAAKMNIIHTYPSIMIKMFTISRQK